MSWRGQAGGWVAAMGLWRTRAAFLSTAASAVAGTNHVPVHPPYLHGPPERGARVQPHGAPPQAPGRARPPPSRRRRSGRRAARITPGRARRARRGRTWRRARWRSWRCRCCAALVARGAAPAASVVQRRAPGAAGRLWRAVGRSASLGVLPPFPWRRCNAALAAHCLPARTRPLVWSESACHGCHALHSMLATLGVRKRQSKCLQCPRLLRCPQMWV